MTYCVCLYRRVCLAKCMAVFGSDICVFLSNVEKVFNIGTDLKYCEGKERFINETRSRLM